MVSKLKRLLLLAATTIVTVRFIGLRTGLILPVVRSPIDDLLVGANVSTRAGNDGNETITSCFPYNSPAWLDGPRHGNAIDPLWDANSVRKMLHQELPQMLQNPNKFLAQTLAHNSSFFLNFEMDAEVMRDEREKASMLSIRRWSVRLIYLAIFRHQHEPARAEAQQQQEADNRGNNCNAEREKLQLGPYDYECPDTKYLITRMWNNGLGASMEGFAIAALMAGLVTNRTVLILNHAPTTWDQLTPPWPLASCPRRDFQCFFAAPTPCVLTPEQLVRANIYALNRNEKEALFHTGMLPDGHENDRIVYFHPSHQVKSVRFGGKVAPVLHKLALRLIDELPHDDDYSATMRPLLLRAADGILKDGHHRHRTDRVARHDRNNWAMDKIAHGLLFYLLRPRPTHRQRLNHLLFKQQASFPLGFDRSRAIGMPIRASDKCVQESECWSFVRHVQALEHYWFHELGKQSPSSPTVIFTTESRAMIQEYFNYTLDSAAGVTTAADFMPLNSSGTRSSRFSFVTNQHDRALDTGRLAKANLTDMNMTADDAMLLAVSSLQLQLLPQHSVLNCCSNFHKLIQAFLFEGLGAASPGSSFPSSIVRCLQDEDQEPEFRLCCGRPGPRNQCWRQKQKEIEAGEMVANLHGRTKPANKNRKT